MGVALAVVPGIAAAWMWVAPAARGRLHALGQLLMGGAAMVLVGGAWPALVELTPASSRPWISGTSDNRVLSLIFEYNGLGRVDGQAGGPAGGPGGTQSNMFGGGSGPLRLLNSALGGQVGWLLGFALVSGVAILIASRLRRRDPQDRVADRRGRLLPGGRGAVQLRQRDLPPLLRRAAGAVPGCPGRGGRGRAVRATPEPEAGGAGRDRDGSDRRARDPRPLPGPAALADAGARVPRRAHDRCACARALTTRPCGRAGGCPRGAAARARGVGVRHPLLRHQLDLPLRRPRVGRERRPGLRRGAAARFLRLRRRRRGRRPGAVRLLELRLRAGRGRLRRSGPPALFGSSGRRLGGPGGLRPARASPAARPAARRPAASAAAPSAATPPR